MNRADLIGRLGRDPELRFTPNGKAVCKFSIATEEKWGQGDQEKKDVTWHNIVVWGKSAEWAGANLNKGQEVYISGRISNRSYDDKDGNKKYTSEVVAQIVKRFAGSEATTAAREASPQGPQPADDDIPF